MTIILGKCCKLTAGNVDDRKPVCDLMKTLVGKLFMQVDFLVFR